MQFTVRTTQATVTTWAQSAAAARDIVAKAEGCPDSAILSVEIDRKATLRTSPMLMGFLSTMLQDAGMTESEEACMEEREARDSGTIYNCPDETFARAKDICDTFYHATPEVGESDQDYESLGSDLYLECAGHGAGFRDRVHDSDQEESDRIGAALSAAVTERDLTPYFGDDGRVYLS